MKVVINNCYGGFSLSYEAIMLYAKKKGLKIYPVELADHGDLTSKRFVPYYGQRDSEFFIHYLLEPLLDNGELPEKVKFFYYRDLKRDDPILIEVVEELKEKANTTVSALKVVEIPDGIKYFIEEYDGNEWIAEEHRTWS